MLKSITCLIGENSARSKIWHELDRNKYIDNVGQYVEKGEVFGKLFRHKYTQKAKTQWYKVILSCQCGIPR